MKNLSRKDLKKKLDRVFSLYIRLRDSNSNGVVICPLCWKKMLRNSPSCQNMHFVKRDRMKYRYSERNCYAGCVGCNVYLNGNYPKYTLFMIKRYWLEKVEEMLNDKKPFKIRDFEMEHMLQEYSIKACKLAYSKHIKMDKYFSKKFLATYYNDNGN